MIFIHQPLLLLLLLLPLTVTCQHQMKLEGCPMLKPTAPTSEELWVAFTSYSPNNTITTSEFKGVADPSSIPEQPITGVLLKPRFDSSGCNISDYGPPPPGDWIAIVQNGSCDYETQGQIAASLGAKALLNYVLSDDKNVVANVSATIYAVTIPSSVGTTYTKRLHNELEINVTISPNATDSSPHGKVQAKNNALFIVLASIMCPAAILLNTGALIAIVYYPEKPKPHLYLIANLIITDLLVAVTGTLQLFVLGPFFSVFTVPLKAEVQVYLLCFNSLLSGIWDMAMLSNLFTLLSLTTEHFIAFRWPIKHKIVVTRQRILGVIVLQWLVAAAPMIGVLVNQSLRPSLEHCQEENYCRRIFYYTIFEPEYTWIVSLPCVLFVTVVVTVMVLVYGYVIVIVHRVGVRNPGFKKKGTAMVTTSCLIVAFFLSYIYYFTDHFFKIFNNGGSSPFSNEVFSAFSEVCPMCPLILDFLITGMIGAIIDPIIYCMRMKEIKLACAKVCKGRGIFRYNSTTSGGGYTRAVQHSVTVDEHL